CHGFIDFSFNFTYDKHKMKIALSIRKTSERYAIPKSTLFDNVKIIKRGGEASLCSKLGFKKTFDEIYKISLKEHFVNLSNRCMPLTRKEFLKLEKNVKLKKSIEKLSFNKHENLRGKKTYDIGLK
ncbi:hypothetical protein ALC57_10504, partial [Trachymyrmex cornetzi]